MATEAELKAVVVAANKIEADYKAGTIDIDARTAQMGEQVEKMSALIEANPKIVTKDVIQSSQSGTVSFNLVQSVINQFPQADASGSDKKTAALIYKQREAAVKALGALTSDPATMTALMDAKDTDGKPSAALLALKSWPLGVGRAEPAVKNVLNAKDSDGKHLPQLIGLNEAEAIMSKGEDKLEVRKLLLKKDKAGHDFFDGTFRAKGAGEDDAVYAKALDKHLEIYDNTVRQVATNEKLIEALNKTGVLDRLDVSNPEEAIHKATTLVQAGVTTKLSDFKTKVTAKLTADGKTPDEIGEMLEELNDAKATIDKNAPPKEKPTAVKGFKTSDIAPLTGVDYLVQSGADLEVRKQNPGAINPNLAGPSLKA
ncbi:MAG: hypothetical protein SFX19_02820 [Alphaproteobacteria bacterium]|nr:hypothetical protein [Alphaproteobacteria bacterium]